MQLYTMSEKMNNAVNTTSSQIHERTCHAERQKPLALSEAKGKHPGQGGGLREGRLATGKADTGQ
jgi:hypothetical protein